MKLFAFIVLFAVCGAAQSQGVRDTADTATQYMRAWEFKDYSRMYELSTPSTKQSLPRNAFYSAAGALGELTEPSIVSRSTSGEGETVYFQGAKNSAGVQPRGSFVLKREGVEHPQLLGASKPQVAASDPSSAGAPAVVIDGETASSILEKMTKANGAANTLRGALSIRGAMMGQSLNETGTLAYKAPNKFRMDFKSFIMNGDGTQNILYMPALQTYMRMDQLGEFELSPGIGSAAADLHKKYDVTLAGKTQVNGEDAFELAMNPPQTSLSGIAGAAGTGKMKMWISTKNWLPVKATMSGMQVEYGKLQVNSADVTDSTFVFTPPKGAQELSLGSLLGGGGMSIPGLNE